MTAAAKPAALCCSACRGIATRSIDCSCGWRYLYCVWCAQIADLFGRVHAQRHRNLGEPHAHLSCVLRHQVQVPAEVANG